MAIYKIGKDPREYANYRPITLFNVTYKFLAKMIPQQLLHIFGPTISSTAIRFPTGKKHSECDFHCEKGPRTCGKIRTRFMMPALDYRKVFDSVPKQSLREGLIRHEIPLSLIELMMAIYATPLFRVRSTDGSSADYTQDTGIRQGCPLSPLLFITITSY